MLLQAIYIGLHKGTTGRSGSLLYPMKYGNLVHRSCVNVHRLCVNNRPGYTVYAYKGTPFMRGKLAGFTLECGFRW
jgi:hypothetical protein